MKLEEIQQLIEFISRSEFSHFEMENDGVKLKLVRGGAAEMPVVPQAAPERQAPSVPGMEGNGRPQPVPVAAPVVQEQAAPAEDLDEIRSPIVGTFYRSSNPTSDPFVESGSKITSGQTLCIVEAMKLMNEIESDMDGEIVEILVANGQPVEYGELLFRVRRAAH